MRRTPRNARSRPTLEDFEPRILYSADHPAALAATLLPEAASTQNRTIAPAPTDPGSGIELVFIDSRVADAAQMQADIAAQAAAGRPIEAVMLDPEQDGIAQITAVVAQHADIAAIHLISHGSEGSVTLGNGTLDNDSLLQNAADIASWRSHLGANADLLIYGCDVGAGADGSTLLDNLAQLSGATVAASNDDTGNTLLGGDWNLEVQTGTIHASSALDAAGQAGWMGLLAANTAPLLGNAGNGIATRNDSASTSQTMQAVLVQSDGRMVILGTVVESGVSKMLIYRINVDGSPDASFNSNAFGGLTLQTDTGCTGYALAQQADGKLVMVGSAVVSGTTRFVVERVNTNGTVDATFGGGNGGVTTLIASGNAVAHAVAIQGDGKILVAGTALNGSNTAFALARYTSAGALDTSFGGGDGVVTTTIHSSNSNATGMALQSDGKIVLVGTTVSGGENAFSATRYSTTGVLDTSFGNNGNGLTLYNVGTSTSISGVVLQGDGKLLVSGGATVSGDADLMVLRLTTSGLLDTSFNGVGRALANTGGSDTAYGLALQSDGSVVVAGQAVPTSGQAAFAFARFTSTGALDTGFGSAGIATLTIGSGNSGATGVAMTTGGKIVATGPSSGVNALVRLTSAGALDDSFHTTTPMANSLNATENVPAVLNSGATVNDAELNNAGNYAGATLTLVRNGGANAQDQFSGSGVLGALTQGGSLVCNGTTIGSVTTNSGGTLLLTFNASATQALVNAAMRAIAYANGSDAPPASVVINWSFSDGNTGTQGTGGALTATSTTTVTIDAINDAPVITSNGGGASASISIAENSTAVSTVAATDPDGPAITYSISGGADAGRFTINASTGALAFISAPDYENPLDAGNNNVYDVIVRASDGWLDDDQAIAVTITPLNDNTPVITSGGAVSVAENTTAVTTVTATDADLPAQTLSYTLSGGADAARFSLNSSTGALVFNTAPDYENPTDAGLNNVYDVTVRVSDGTFSATRAIAVTVTPVNDNSPAITSNGGGTTASIGIAENATAVTTVTATDADLPANQTTLSYSIAGGADASKFTINASSGALAFIGAPDYENPSDAGTNNVYDVIVRASDGSFSDDQTIAVTVTPVNDNSPVITSNGGGTNASIGITENTTAVTTVTATDADLPANQTTLTYSISGGADAAKFKINATTGVLAFINAPDYDAPGDSGANNVYDVIVQASDGTLTDTQTLAVSVGNANEAPSFYGAGNGTVTTNFGSGHTYGNGVVVQGDGKAIVVGEAAGPTGRDFGITRYNTDGSLDTGFNGTGTLALSLSSGDDIAYSVALQSDGKILVAGVSSNDFGLVRLNADGTLDSSFGSGGKVSTDFNGGTDAAVQVMVQLDGRVVVAGTVSVGGLQQVGLVRYNADGSLDTSFGTGGKVNTVPIASTSSTATAAALHSDGRIVVAGTTSNGGQNDFAVLRYNSNGTLDNSFGTAGIKIFGNAAVADIARGVAIQADGKIVVSGETRTGSTYDFMVARLTASGAVDTAFGSSNNGMVVTDVAGNDDHGYEVAIQSDGRIVVVGSAVNAGNQLVAVVRYNSDGSLDTGFNGSGKQTTNLTAANDEIGRAVAIGPDGSIFVAGQVVTGSYDAFALLRYNAVNNSGGAAGTLSNKLGSATATLGNTIAYTENASGTVISSTVSVTDPELDNAASYAGATVAIARSGGANAQDVFAASGLLVTLTQGNALIYNGTTIGTVTTNGAGSLLLSFNANASATLIAAALRCITYANSSDAPPASVTLLWTLNDGNSGSQGSGGALSGTGTTKVNIAPVNDAPALSGGGTTLTGINEDLASPPGQSIASFLGSSITDPDGTGLPQGIAITAASTANGAWQYSTNGGSAWTAVPGVTDSSALLLRSSDWLRFVPDAKNGTAATITYRAWDQFSGSVGTQVDTSSNGGITAFSNSTVNGTLTVSSVNDAPQLTAIAPTLATITEDQTTTSQLVSTFLSPITDVDAGALQGIAITSMVSNTGVWKYSTDGGSTWTAVPTVSASAALLLRSTDLIRFVPDTKNSTTASITYCAWDQSSGTAGTQADASSPGGISAFSNTSDTASITATTLNDAPLLAAFGPVLATITEDQTSNPGQTVASFIGSSITDVDSGALAPGIAIDATSSAIGAWQYSVDGGSTWLAVGTVSDGQALLLRGTDKLRLLPDTLNGGNAMLTYRGWDQTSGSAGSKVDASSNGGTSAFSQLTDTVTQPVTAINDAPVLGPGSGKVTTDVANLDDQGEAILVQPDGKIIVAGNSLVGSAWAYTLVRYNAGGSLDTSFGVGGKAVFSGNDDGAYAVALQSDGKIVIAGRSYNNANDTDFSLLRANADGSLDLSFGGTGSGRVLTNFSGGGDQITSISVLADDRIVVGGYTSNTATGNTDYAFARYTAAGVLDSSFGHAGTATFDFAGTNDQVVALTLQSDGKIVAAGQTTSGGQLQASLMRLNANGSLDTSFGSGGYALLRPGTSPIGSGVAVQGNGSLLLSGTYGGSAANFFVARYSAAGVLDGSFGTAGVTTTDFGGTADSARGLVLQADGSLLVWGDRVVGGQSDLALARYLSNGTLDTSFGGGTGLVTTSVVSGASDYARGAFVQGDGSILVTGYSAAGPDIGLLVRYNADGSLSTAFGGANAIGYTENATAGALNSTITLTDAELSALNNFSGATLTLSRDGGANAQDVFSALGLLGSLTQGGNLVYGGVVIGTVTSNSGGTLVLAFNGNATQARVNGALQSIAYANSSDAPPASVQIDWVVNDGNSGAQGSGGALGSQYATTVTIAALNDAPALATAMPSLTGGSEDQTAPAGQTVASFLGSTITDPDGSGLAQGIAITAASSTSGGWQYSTNGGSNWSAFGTVSASASLLLRASDWVRFVPDARNGTSATFSYRAWDQTSGLFGFSVSTTSNGGGTAFSNTSNTATLVTTSVNDAPTFASATPAFPGITEDDTGNGQLVSVIAGSNIGDVDSGALKGIAITAIANSNGVWQYSIDAGSTWAAVSGVGSTTSLLLAATDRLRFVPDGKNADSASITFRAWDQTSGTHGTLADSSAGGGTSAFSLANDSSTLAVSAVNDAPEIKTPGGQNLNGISEDQLTSSQTVASFLGSSISDVDSGAAQGIAITGMSNTAGTSWQYSTNNGTSWSMLTAPSTTAARLLRASDLIRFVPDGHNGGSASISYVAWDTTSGTAGNTANVTTRGGSTAFSLNADSATITVSDLNDAPTLIAGVPAPTLTGINEDQTSNAANPGQLVSSFTNSSDVDTNALKGIAIIAANNGNSAWQFSIDGGSSWQAVGTPSSGAALLLRSTDLIRFLPDTKNGTTATISYVAWDQTSGNAGDTVNTGTRGGISAFSTGSETATLVVSAVNDAPRLANASPVLTSVNEDQIPPPPATNPGQLVSDILGGTVSDDDTGAPQGIAITASSNGTGAGTWQFSTNGGSSWTALGGASDSTAQLLRSSDLIRYLPDGKNGTTASFSYRAWDQSSGSVATPADTTGHGGSSAFSDGSNTATIVVSSLNDAPKLAAATPVLTSITEDQISPASNPGQLVSDLVGSTISDDDSIALQGIAITATVNGNGGWQFSLDGGSSWQAVGSPSNGAAVLLRASDRIRFLPDGHNGTAASFSYRAWDQTSGSAGDIASTTANGGITAFSTGSNSASIVVTSLNDAPLLASASPSLPALTEDQTNDGGELVSTLVGASITDVDNAAIEGIAITATSISGGGTWQYWIDGGTTWTTISGAADSTALLLRATDSLRFVPDGKNGATGSITYCAWDQTSGSAGGRADTTLNGDTSAFSTTSNSASISITPLNDTPTLAAATPVLPDLDEDQIHDGGQLVSTLVGATIGDVDSGAVQGIAITAATVTGGGAWQFSSDGGSTWSAISGATNGSALLLRAGDKLRFLPDGKNGATGSISYRAWDQTSGSFGNSADTSVNGGTSAFSNTSNSASITVTSLNDAPTLTPPTPAATLTGLTEDQVVNPGQTVASIVGNSIDDVDASALEGIAITAHADGNGAWEYSIDAGSHWLRFSSLSISASAALMLRASDLVRFVPDGKTGTTGSISYRAWDQTSGSAGTLADPGIGGGTSAFSTASDSAGITVSSLNDAPVLSVATPVLLPITEDQLVNPGQTVGSFVAGTLGDVDGSAPQGIAITGLNNGIGGSGGWQFSIDGGSHWNPLGTPSGSSARLLRDSDWIRFVPNGANGTTASITYRAWDQSDNGAAGALANTTTNGGTSAFSNSSTSASIVVSSLNDAPVLHPVGQLMTSLTDTDITNPGQSVAAIVGTSITDVDSISVQGIAITAADPGNGSWQYSIDNGSTWQSFGSLGDAAALLLGANDFVRFVPNGISATVATFDYVAWDRTDSGVPGSHVDSSVRGGTSAFSLGSDRATERVDYLNNAPTLAAATPVFAAIDEDATGNPGNPGETVATLVDLQIGDADIADSQGIAITSTMNGNGTWQYSLDGGASWQDVNGVNRSNDVDDAAALLLRASDWLRFLPDGHNGTNASLTYRAWDQTSGGASSRGDTTVNGGSSAFSTDSNTATIVVRSLNDAPTLDDAAPVLLGLDEDQTNDVGQVVGDLIGAASLHDVDIGALQGIAITGAASVNGTWQFSLDNGANWSDVGGVSEGAAGLLRLTYLLRFKPDGKNGGDDSFIYRAWDQSEGGLAGALGDATSTGGTHAFSDDSNTATIHINDLNDAPTLSGATPALTPIDEDQQTNPGQSIGSFTAGTIGDDDHDALQGIAITSHADGHGAWQYSIDAGAHWTTLLAGDAASDAGALLLRASDLVRFVPDGKNADGATLGYRAWDQTSGSAGATANAGVNGNTSAFSSSASQATITVAAVNDAPTLTTTPQTLPSITEDAVDNPGQSVGSFLASNDVDSSALKGIAITAHADGLGYWEYSVAGGAWTLLRASDGTGDANALLLADSDLIRFVPDARNTTVASISFRAWDRSDLRAAGTSANVSVNGNSTPFSSTVASASITATPVNDAPQLAAAPTSLTPITEDQIAVNVNPGQSVGSFLGTITDVDSGALRGMAITAHADGLGHWEYSIDGGSHWTQIFATDAASDGAALLLRASDRLRFVPDGQNETTASLTYRAWDRSDLAAAGSVANIVAVGGISAFSSGTSTASITVTPVNDAPTLSTLPRSLTTIDEDQLGNPGQTIDSFIGASAIGDVDSVHLQGIAITAHDDGSGNGHWEYAIGGGAWKILAPSDADSDANALLLGASDRVRFVPDGRNGTSASLTYRAWDQSGSAQAGAFADTTVNGGSSAFSVDIATATITVDPRNDAPVMTPTLPAPVLLGIDEDLLNGPGQTVALFLGSRIDDVDDSALQGIAITAHADGNGHWEYSTHGGGAWTQILAGDAASDGAALLLRANDLIRFVPDGHNGTIASLTYRAWDQSDGALAGSVADATLHGGMSAFSDGIDTATITVSSLNDAPTLSPLPRSLAGIDENQLGNPGQTIDSFIGAAAIGDVDSVHPQGIAITAHTDDYGDWQYSTDDGATWNTIGATDAASDSTALLLRSTDRVRFVPDGKNGSSASLTYRAWDQSDGAQAGSVRDTTLNGGTSAFSTGTATATITVDPINDAPVLATTPRTLPSLTEDQGNNLGQSVGAFLSGTITDVDIPSLQGTAIHTHSDGGGAWEFSLDGGGSWTAIGTSEAISDGAALLLRSTDLLRFVPDGENGTTASIGYRAWDQSDHGVAGTFADAGVTGNDTAFSDASASASITVTSLNDAPTLPAAGTAALTSIDEDQIGLLANPGQSVASIVGATTLGDVDSNALHGIAITAHSDGNGAWQYSIDGGSHWLAFDDLSVGISASSALLLRDSDLLRFVPDGKNGSTGTLTYRAWDQTSGTAGVQADASVNGGTSAFSTDTNIATIIVRDVNDAPTLTAAATTVLAPITEDDTGNAGQTVGTILDASFSDVDIPAPQGIALTAASTVNGGWQYSLDGGSSWSAVGSVSDGAALLLRASDLLRFEPDSENGGTATLGFRAWDQSSGTAGNVADASLNGGITAFSSTTNSASLVVRSINDAPEMTPIYPVLAPLTEDDQGNPGQRVDEFIGGAISDVDSAALQGIAINAHVDGNGSWQYSLDNGARWLTIGAVNSNSALLLRASDSLRFVPNGANATSGSISYQAWDQSSGSGQAGDYVNAAISGGTTAFSDLSDAATIAVSAVNDAPVLASATPSLPGLTEDQSDAGHSVASFLASSITDADLPSLQGIAVTAHADGHGVWQYSIDNGVGWTTIGPTAAMSDSGALLLRSSDLLRFVPDGENGGTASLTYRAWDRSSGSAGGTADASVNGGSTAFSLDSNSLSITVTSLNDAPTLPAAGTAALTSIDEDQIGLLANPGQSVASIVGATTLGDVDSNALHGIAITAHGDGNGAWQYSIDGGSHWLAFNDLSVGVSGSSALLLNDSDLLRFVPDGKNGSTGTLTYRAWDQTSGSAGAQADASVNGGTSAFSTDTNVATIVVRDVNDAPTLAAAATTVLAPITEDDIGNAGQTVGTILDASFSDVDIPAPQGIALTAASTVNGGWQYSLDGGSTWSTVGSVSDSAALLLRASDLLRFEPDSENGGTATLGFRAWDQSSGIAGNAADARLNGGTTAFSSTANSASLAVRSINDAPVLAAAHPALPSIDEDQTTNGGQSVAAFIGSSISDVDSGAVQGIAIVGSVDGSGSWQVSIDGGANWLALGSVSDSAAKLLRPTDLLRFVPGALGATAGSISYRAWDQTSGTAGGSADASLNGGTTAFGNTTNTATLAVTAINHAPTLNGANPLAAIVGHATSNAGSLVSSLIAGQVGDIDANAVQGIAVVAVDDSHGSWQYSLDGGASWLAFGSVGNTTARLLAADATSVVRFVPNDGWSGTVGNGLGFRAWDRSSGTAGGTADTSSHGGNTAFSSAVATSGILVLAAAPSGSNATLTIDEDTSLVLHAADFGFVDASGTHLLAVTLTPPTAGTLSLNGVVIRTVQTVSVVDIDAGQLVFTPAPNVNGQGAASLGFQVQDDGGSANGRSDVDASPKTLSFDVTAVNDAPVLTPIAPRLAPVATDDTRSTGQTVQSLIGTSISDVDSPALQGIAITAQAQGHGSWQFSLDGGRSWQALGAVSEGDALLLRASDRLRFVPDSSGAGPASFSYRAWDQTQGQAGTRADLRQAGGASAFSTAADQATIEVTATAGNATLRIVSPGADKLLWHDGVLVVATVVGEGTAVPARTLHYFIAGGADAARFTIDAASGQLRFAASPLDGRPQGTQVFRVVVGVGDGVLEATKALDIIAPGRQLQPMQLAEPPAPPAALQTLTNDVRQAGYMQREIAARPALVRGDGDDLPSPTAWTVRPRLSMSMALASLHIAAPRLHSPSTGSGSGPDDLLAMLRFQLQPTAHHGAAANGRHAPVVADPVEPPASAASAAITPALIGGLAISAALLAWASRGSALLSSFLISAPAWRSFDLLPVLKQADKQKRPQDATEAPAGFDEPTRPQPLSGLERREHDSPALEEI